MSLRVTGEISGDRPIAESALKDGAIQTGSHRPLTLALSNRPQWRAVISTSACDAANSRPCPGVTPLWRENFRQLTRRAGEARLRRALPRCAVPGMLCGGTGVAERLWSRSFADVVLPLAGVTPSNPDDSP